MGAWQTLKQGFFSPSDAIADSNPIHTRKRIRLNRELQSDGSCRVNRMRCRLSIRCASAFQSIETFFGVLTCFFGPKGDLDANIFHSLFFATENTDAPSASRKWLAKERFAKQAAKRLREQTPNLAEGLGT